VNSLRKRWRVKKGNDQCVHNRSEPNGGMSMFALLP
jgi:hypothetical protein